MKKMSGVYVATRRHMPREPVQVEAGEMKEFLSN